MVVVVITIGGGGIHYQQTQELAIVGIVFIVF